MTAKKTTSKKKVAKKTAKKTASNKTAKGKTAARKTARPGSAELIAAAEAKRDMLDTLGSLGLIDAAADEALVESTEALPGAADGFGAVTEWDRSLAGHLDAFAAAGGDGKAGTTHQSLLVWQRSLAELSAGPDGVLQALTGLKRVFGYTGATVYLRDTEADRVTPWVFHGFRVDLISRIRFAGGDGFSAWVAGRKKPVLYSALHRNEAPREDQVRSFMAVPMVVGGECVGVVTMGHSQEDTFNQQSLRTLILAAEMLGGLVHKHLADGRIRAREIRDRETGLFTAHYFRSRVDEEVVRCRELGYSAALVAVRLNEVPEYTERFGAEYGERVRDELGELLTDWREGPELVGHGEDDRVFVLLPGAHGMRAEQRVRELAARIEAHSFPRRKRMTVSLGMAAYPADAEDAQDLLSLADKALNETWRARTGRTEPVPASAAA